MYQRQSFLERYWGWSIPAILAFVIVYFAWPRQIMAEITASEWTRYYQIQSLQTVKHYDMSGHPSGARVFGHGMEQQCTGIDPHKICMWVITYDYEIEEFVNNRIVTVTHNYRTEPYWPQYTLSGLIVGAPYGVGQERVGQAIGVYSLVLETKDGDVYVKELPMKEWKLYEPHQSVYLTTSFGRVVKIRQLEI